MCVCVWSVSVDAGETNNTRTSNVVQNLVHSRNKHTACFTEWTRTSARVAQPPPGASNATAMLIARRPQPSVAGGLMLTNERTNQPTNELTNTTSRITSWRDSAPFRLILISNPKPKPNPNRNPRRMGIRRNGKTPVAGVITHTTWELKVKAEWSPRRELVFELRAVTCHMGSHSVTCHPTQVNAPRLNHSQ